MKVTLQMWVATEDYAIALYNPGQVESTATYHAGNAPLSIVMNDSNVCMQGEASQ